MNKLFLLFICISMLLACSSSKELGPDDNGVHLEEYDDDVFQETEHQAIFENIGRDDSLFASINRGACFGKCPIFDLKIYNSGFVVLEGKNFIDLIGRYTTTLTKEQMLFFIEKAMEIDYMEMEDEYDNAYITDLPSTTTSIVINGKRKQVRRRHGYPPAIVTFEKLFNDLLESEKWAGGIEK